MTLCYLGLGANLQKPLQQIQNAVKALQASPAIQVLRSSSLYASKPMGPQDQPDYVNAVVLIETNLQPLELLNLTQSIETLAGRERKQHWGPRTLDVDILLIDQLQLSLPQLTVPHPGLHEREFVLYPLAEIAPDLMLPDGTPVAQACQRVALNGLQKIAPATDY
ncbi:2-amino-4-hydroxy-6-hydroxymethyldihydropteridine diphosphokinase [Aliidiomarina minuta]|uniref:2-amino-4-hydroxy-6-hydroxymethyldihydropteridine pyrophosphokinase n=1 Tax=Aliidiomarina minuta TaxID=880057 RepID=A0A432W463_9GAMM|nr:2-amino-4-hydroxy-6-hydroxymethyldihydropteridine diphosphokinase [Aliidiomarina minuta]RUO24282.1 2-amino-4-hydroxy-6-hydroxymethyldihydropteridine diphosphokinase [Aliidiomarina minuta]